MKLIGSDSSEPEDDGTPTGDVNISITVPEVFLGTAIGQVSAHRGSITDIKHEAEVQVIYASVPAPLFQSLVDFVTEQSDGTAIVRIEET